MAWAEPGKVRMTSSRPASRISTGRSWNSLRSRSSPLTLSLDQARRQGVGLGPLSADLDQAQLGHVPADRGLGRPEATLAERRGQLLLRPDQALVDQVPDGALAELLHHLHRAGPARRMDVPGRPQPAATTTDQPATTSRSATKIP